MNKRLLLTFILSILIFAVVFISYYIFLNPKAKPWGKTSRSTLTNSSEESALNVKDIIAHSRSHFDLLKNGNHIKVFLFAGNESMKKLNSYYCGGDKGANRYSGFYQLISLKDNSIVSKVTLGNDYFFVSGKPHDGIRQYKLPGINETLIAIYQYNSCNGDGVEFYRISDSGVISRVYFIKKDGRKLSKEGTGPEGKIFNKNNLSVFCSYDNTIYYTLCTAYKYDGKNFVETLSSMVDTGIGEKKEEFTDIGRARRALYDYLQASNRGDYKAAAYYYGGSYDFLIPNNPDINPSNKEGLFKRYCQFNGKNRCALGHWTMSGIKEKSPISQSEMRFVVTFEELMDTAVRKIDFRLKRIGGEFKVLALPPRLPQ